MAESTPRVPTPEAIQKRWQGLFDALNHENDRVCAIVATSYVEHCLRALLRKRFVKCDTAKGLLDPTRGALGLLHDAAALAYSVGAISDGCRKNIERIGGIRNLFAHSIDEIGFSAANVVALCNEIAVPIPAIIGATAFDNQTPEEAQYRTEANPRDRFTIASCMICTTLMLDALGAEHMQKRVDYWDHSPPPAPSNT